MSMKNCGIVEFNYVYAEKTTEERGSRDVETRCPFNRKTKLEQEIINGFFSHVRLTCIFSDIGRSLSKPGISTCGGI